MRREGALGFGVRVVREDRKGSVGKEEQNVVLRWGGCDHLVDLPSGLCGFGSVLYVTLLPAYKKL